MGHVFRVRFFIKIFMSTVKKRLKALTWQGGDWLRHPRFGENSRHWGEVGIWGLCPQRVPGAEALVR